MVSQVIGRGVIRGAGKQLVGTILTFVGFYVVGLPLGVSLMFKTHLKLKGEQCGFSRFKTNN